MPRLPPMKSGTVLKANRRPVPFSFWPVATTSSRRKPVQSRLFAIDPWMIMKRCIADQIHSRDTRNEATSYIDQASDFYNSALRSQIDAAKPVQLYYSYLNIAKAFILCRGIRHSLSRIRHGVNEAVPQGGNEYNDAYVQFWTSLDNNGNLQAFDEFLLALGHPSLPNQQRIPIVRLIPQILPGHRLWATATNQKERFLSLQRIQFTENVTTKKVWLRFYLYQDDLTRLSYSQNDVLQQSGAVSDFHKVKCLETVDLRNLICFEQSIPMSFNRHGVDVATALSQKIRRLLWSTVASSSPYRRYYYYLCPTSDTQALLPQLASIYALTYYLGSVTRYRPTVFRSILDGPHGPRIAEFISGQPAQFIYLMASEFAKREVTQPALV